MTYAPDAADLVPAAVLKYDNVEAMANAVGSSSDTGDTSADDGNLGASEVAIRRRRVGREQLGDDELQDLVEEE